MVKAFKVSCVFILILAALNIFAQNVAKADDLLTQIQLFQNQNGIQIEGIDKIQNSNTNTAGGNPDQQVKQLFGAYNHITVRNKKGRIERIVILNKKQKAKDDRIVLPFVRQGSHFTVDVAISGDGRIWQELAMILDTGADLVVLPESMIETIGLKDSTFTQAKMQTANGEANAKIGLLKELRMGGETVENVEAAFVADQLLGENKLLGMSLLNRFQLNIDDKNHLITLIKKPVTSETP